VVNLTYTYACNECEKEFLVTKGINEDIEIECECGSTDVRRVYSVPNFKINCSGFCGKIGK
jgi:putative FmdB family regulatory protein